MGMTREGLGEPAGLLGVVLGVSRGDKNWNIHPRFLVTVTRGQ